MDSKVYIYTNYGSCLKVYVTDELLLLPIPSAKLRKKAAVLNTFIKEYTDLDKNAHVPKLILTGDTALQTTSH